MAVIQRLARAVLEEVRVDAQRALRLAEAAVLIAQRVRNRDALALSLRAKANALYVVGDNKTALEFHHQALKIFRTSRNLREVGRTLSTSTQPMILLGEYEPAFAAAREAGEIFEQLGDERGLIHVENNVGNIYHRQDRFEEALACYERAYQRLLPHRNAQELGIALTNIATCLIPLNDFPRALAIHQQARQYCDEYGMPLLKAQTDYNIAYLYFLRGDYGLAIEGLRASREACKKTGDAYHLALCHLDLSEIYLELNLSSEAEETAREGFRQFQKLNMGYEAAKCLANEAISISQEGQALRSLELFGRARAMFVREKNMVWPWLVDLYQALVLFNEGRYFEARRLCAAALQFFAASTITGKTILCHLLLARILLRMGEPQAAKQECERALHLVAKLEAPLLRHQAYFLFGQIEQSLGRRDSAFEAYRMARAALEALRGSLHGEELKIAFMKNRFEVYEALVDLRLPERRDPAVAEEIFGYIGMAKSRSMAEMLLQHSPGLPAKDTGESDLVGRIRDLREGLNWYYHRIEIEQLRPEERTTERLDRLQQQVKEREIDLVRALRELQVSSTETATLPNAGQVSLEAVQASLPPDSMLLEYFSVGEKIVVALVSRDSLHIEPVTLTSRVSHLLRQLRFQLSKFRLGAEYADTFAQPLLAATQSHLLGLYEEVFAPIREQIRSRHIIVAPHGILHYLPFHAMFDGRQHLMDNYTISYAPSAGVYALCYAREPNREGSSLVLGVPDERAPMIREEVEAVAAILPDVELFLGNEATLDLLRTKGAAARIIHIATHGNFRQDNPLFSGIRLGDSYLNFYDLHQLHLDAELVTLSGCATGLNVVAAGDELLGLIRGLLFAGSRSLLLTLWDVHDRSTSDFMKGFYQHWRETGDKAVALQKSMRTIRNKYPHPYYWAPFTLICEGRTPNASENSL
ncbi:MAG TPA: CHAT domain-containing tetratricopeptide repeat protein [Candidatus Dormibacteraeota bacterium]|nr:CHAT domain-containing tetratricopeptide repeat protein [Candidatus Dormibacteraeota bacterium]